MVTRKPVGPRVSTSQANNASQDTANPPYPATPLDSNKIPGSTNSIYSPNLGTSPAFDLIDMQEAQNRPRRDSDVSSHGTWDSPDEDDRETPDENELPPPLRIAPGKQKAMQNENGENKQEELPASLRPGPTGGASAPLAARSQDGGINYQEEAQSNPWSQTQRPQEQPEQPNGRFESNNPYLNTQQTGSAPASRPDSEHIPPSQDQQHLAWQQTAKNYTPWGASANPPPPINPPPDAPAELPAVHTPADELSKMSLGAPPYPSSDEPPSVPETTPKSRIQEPPLSAITERTESVASVNPWEQPTPEQKWDDHAAVPPPAPPLPGSSAQSPPYPQEDGVPQVPPVPHTNHGHSLIDDDETPATTLFQQRTASPPKPERNVPAPIDVSHPATTASQSIPANPETPRTQASRQRNVDSATVLQHSKPSLCNAFVTAIQVGKGTWRQFRISIRDMRHVIFLATSTARCLRPRRAVHSISGRAFSVSSCALRTLKPWSEAESQKVQDLLEQGLSSGRIAKQLENRTFYAVRRHLAKSRRTPGERAGSSTKSWTPEEDKILASKRAAGLKHAEILPSLPGRSIEAVRSAGG